MASSVGRLARYSRDTEPRDRACGGMSCIIEPSSRLWLRTWPAKILSRCGGTVGSNPPPSSGESHANRIPLPIDLDSKKRPESRFAPHPRLPISVVLCWRRQPPRRTRQQLPAAVLFLPDLHDPDFGIGDFAVELAFRDPKMTHDGVVPDDLDRSFRPFERLEGSLSRHRPVDELGLVL